MGQVSRQLGLTETAVREWVQTAEIEEGKRPGLTAAEREESVRLRRQVRVLEEEKGHPQEGSDFLRQGNPLSRYRFIEAERTRCAVTTVCRVLQVSLAAY